jgi:CheY-like chemotaxis protein
MAFPPKVAAPLAFRLRVLVAEHDADARALYVHTLKRCGLDVYEACDGEAALRLLALINFNLIVLDVALPKAGDVSLTDAIAADARMRDVPVVLVTATDVNPERLQVQQVLRKPFQPDRLLAAVSSVFASLGD